MLSGDNIPETMSKWTEMDIGTANVSEFCGPVPVSDLGTKFSKLNIDVLVIVGN